MNDRQSTLGVAVIVAVVLTLSVFVSGPFHQPRELRTPDYAIAHESTEAFDEVLNETTLDPNDSVEISALSRETRRAFSELKAQPVESRYGHSGWQHTEITVCDGRMLACDEYAERPDFRTTRSSYSQVADRPSISVSVVTHEGERYVVSRVLQSSWDISPLAEGVTLVLVATYGLFIVGFAYHRGSANPLLSLAFTGFGVQLALWPYAMMYSGLDKKPIRFLVAVLLIGMCCWIAVWIVDWFHENG